MAKDQENTTAITSKDSEEEKEDIKKEFERARSNPFESKTYKVVKRFFQGFNAK